MTSVIHYGEPGRGLESRRSPVCRASGGAPLEPDEIVTRAEESVTCPDCLLQLQARSEQAGWLTP